MSGLIFDEIDIIESVKLPDNQNELRYLVINFSMDVFSSV